MPPYAVSMRSGVQRSGHPRRTARGGHAWRLRVAVAHGTSTPPMASRARSRSRRRGREPVGLSRGSLTLVRTLSAPRRLVPATRAQQAAIVSVNMEAADPAARMSEQERESRDGGHAVAHERSRGLHVVLVRGLIASSPRLPRAHTESLAGCERASEAHRYLPPTPLTTFNSSNGTSRDLPPVGERASSAAAAELVHRRRRQRATPAVSARGGSGAHVPAVAVPGGPPKKVENSSQRDGVSSQ